MRTSAAPYALPGFLTLDRLRAGAALHRRTGLPILVTGGSLQPDRPAIATVMADSLRDGESSTNLMPFITGQTNETNAIQIASSKPTTKYWVEMSSTTLPIVTIR